MHISRIRRIESPVQYASSPALRPRWRFHRDLRENDNYYAPSEPNSSPSYRRPRRSFSNNTSPPPFVCPFSSVLATYKHRRRYRSNPVEYGENRVAYNP